MERRILIGIFIFCGTFLFTMPGAWPKTMAILALFFSACLWSSLGRPVIPLSSLTDADPVFGLVAQDILRRVDPVFDVMTTKKVSKHGDLSIILHPQMTAGFRLDGFFQRNVLIMNIDSESIEILDVKVHCGTKEERTEVLAEWGYRLEDPDSIGAAAAVLSSVGWQRADAYSEVAIRYFWQSLANFLGFQRSCL